MKCLGWYDRVDKVTGRLFEQYGGFAADNPWTLIAISILANCFLGLGVSRIEIEDDIELLYTPENSQAFIDRVKVQSVFGESSSINFFPQSQSGSGYYGDLIFQSQKENILSLKHMADIKAVYDTIIDIKIINNNGIYLTYEDVCAKRKSKCVTTGEFLFTSVFQNLLLSNNISYPLVGSQSIQEIFGDIRVDNGTLYYASIVKIRFNLREDSATTENVKLWLKKFLEVAKTVSANDTEVYYADSDSLSEEISSNLDDDIMLFAFTFAFMILYASLATANWKCVSDKQNLARAGVLATLLSVLGSIGLVSSCHVKFVSIAGVMPFLILGIGVDDMFVLLSGLTETYGEDIKLKPRERIKRVMKTSGISITITTLTDLIAFYVGSASQFLSVKNFCIYTGAAVLFCYLNYMTFFMGCMTIHEQRIEDGKHCCSCRKIIKEDIEKNEEKSATCDTSRPKSKEDIEGPMEKYPQKVIGKIVLFKPIKSLIIGVFIFYLGISIWGSLHFEQGLDLNILVSEDSYLYKYNELDRKYFPKSIPISFVIQHNGLYSDNQTQKMLKKLREEAESDPAINPEKTLNWLEDYQKTVFYDCSSESNFTTSLRKHFLPVMAFYKNDIVLDYSLELITASRIFVFTFNTEDINSYHDVMPRMRKIAEKSLLDRVTAYSPSFIFFEQYEVILPETIQSLGVAVLAIFTVTLIFLPHPVLIFFITITLVMIIVGLFGFMYFWDLSLSFLTMVHIIMSVGFSVDFSAHICHGFMEARASDREMGAQGAIQRAGAPIFNGALSSLIGIIMLVFSKSYIFQSFFKIMFLIIIFGAAHSLFFLPTVLSLLGPTFDTKVDTLENGPVISVMGGNKVHPFDKVSKPKFQKKMCLSRTCCNFKDTFILSQNSYNRENPKTKQSRRFSF